MNAYLIQTQCFYRVYKQLKIIGLGAQAAEDAVLKYRGDLIKIAQLTKQLPNSTIDVIATLVLLELMLTKCHKPHYSLYHIRNRLQDRFLRYLQSEQNHRNVYNCYSNTLNNVLLKDKVST